VVRWSTSFAPMPIFHHYPPYSIPFETFWDISHKRPITSQRITLPHQQTPSDNIYYHRTVTVHLATRFPHYTVECVLSSTLCYIYTDIITRLFRPQHLIFFNVLLTAHPCIIFFKLSQIGAHYFFVYLFQLLYMFRATMCLSSGEFTVFMRHWYFSLCIGGCLLCWLG